MGTIFGFGGHVYIKKKIKNQESETPVFGGECFIWAYFVIIVGGLFSFFPNVLKNIKMKQTKRGMFHTPPPKMLFLSVFYPNDEKTKCYGG